MRAVPLHTVLAEFLGRLAALALAVAGAACSTTSNEHTPNGSGGSDNGGTSTGGSAALGGAAGTSASGGSSGSSTGGTQGGSAGSGGTAGSAGNGGSGGGSPCTGSGGASSVTSICGSRPLNSLTAQEATQLCNDTTAYVRRAVGSANVCKYAAIVNASSQSAPTEGELQAACTAAESSCNQDDNRMTPTALCGDIPPTCTATVEQYSACVVDEGMLFDQGASALVDCSTLTFANLSTAFDVPTTASEAPSCMALMTACSNFFPPYIN
jgi:hypothetical protein